jgi:hypothetical protein
MKLSEAIRLGSMLKRQGFGSSAFDPDRSCVLLAACDAIGEAHNNAGIVALYESHWRWAAAKAKCPECQFDGNGHFSVTGISAHLNDDHRWTRERIADWVESVERQQEQSKLNETPAAVCALAPSSPGART